MQIKKSTVIMMSQTTLVGGAVEQFLRHYGVPEWETDTPNDGEKLVEIAGKMCYRSFREDLNPNLSMVRTGDNKGYLKNIMSSGHGSVLEHVHVGFAFLDISRVFTHELVRHRLANYSQESLRFVRLTNLDFRLPEALSDPKVEEVVFRTILYLEEVQKDLAELTGIVDEKTFKAKKEITSALRRLAPIGLLTNVIMTTNIRQWRQIIAKRTHVSAEEEIREVFKEVAIQLADQYPNFFQDMDVNGKGECVFEYTC